MGGKSKPRILSIALVPTLATAVYVLGWNQNAYLVGYASSVLGGIFLSWLCWELLHRGVDRFVEKGDDDMKQPAVRVFWLPFLIGVFERTIITTLVAFKVPGAAGFVGTWITAKALGGWSQWAVQPSTPYKRAVFMSGLLSSGVSAGIGVGGGIIVILLTR